MQGDSAIPIEDNNNNDWVTIYPRPSLVLPIMGTNTYPAVAFKAYGYSVIGLQDGLRTGEEKSLKKSLERLKK